MPKGLPWFRMYERTVNCAKVQRLSDKHFRGWVNLLCCVSNNSGVIPSWEQFAFQMRMTEVSARALVHHLMEAHLVDQNEDGTLMAHDWNEHQYVSDNSTERVRKHREKQLRNVSVTPSEQNRTETEQIQNRTEPETAHSHTRGDASLTEIDDGWGAFTEAWLAAGLTGPSGPDWQAGLDVWRHRMDVPLRLGAVAYLPTVTADNPVSKMLPKGYLLSRAWTRGAASPRAPVARNGPNRAQQANDERTARVIAKLEAERR